MNRVAQLWSLSDYRVALSTGTSTSRELIERQLEICREDAAGLNAFTFLNDDTAFAAAEAADRRRAAGKLLGPLDGVPVAVKDNFDLAGIVTTSGFGARPERQPAITDAVAVAALKAAGAVLLGRTSMHEGALGATTDNPHFGPCHNPLRHGYTPGGSSGGSAAAVAAGLVPLALGTDTMGSVRLPAAYCGVTGFKPSLDVIPTRGVEPLSWSFDHVGPIAGSVTDLIQAMSCLSLQRYLQQQQIALADVRFARLSNLDGPPVSDVMVHIIDTVCGALRRNGAGVVNKALPDYDPSFLRRQGLLIIEAEAAAVHRQDFMRHPGAYSPEFQKMLNYGAEQSAERVAKAGYAVHRFRQQVRALFDDIDIIIAPTAAGGAFPFAAETPNHQADYTAVGNLAGLPAISLPAGRDESGLPLGVQLLGGPYRDRYVLEVAALVEPVCRELTGS